MPLPSTSLFASCFSSKPRTFAAGWFCWLSMPVCILIVGSSAKRNAQELKFSGRINKDNFSQGIGGRREKERETEERGILLFALSQIYLRERPRNRSGPTAPPTAVGTACRRARRPKKSASADVGPALSVLRWPRFARAINSGALSPLIYLRTRVGLAHRLIGKKHARLGPCGRWAAGRTRC